MARTSPQPAPGQADDPAITLAMAYARQESRPVLEDLFALDRRLADAVRQASEPIIAQMKLAWWRDRFAQDRGDWPKGEPLLARLAAWDADVSRLATLVDGWEGLLAEGPLTEGAIFAFAEGRADAWALAARALDAGDSGTPREAAQAWSCADLAQHCSEPVDAQRVRDVARARLSGTGERLPGALRPMAVLGALGRRSLRTGRPILSGPADFLAAVRAGMLGS
ncbi:MAG: hypothetical protein GW855_02320 [Erythrobacter sp.]|nr:hypothetical protein [Erythrobacter sp.]NCQ63477.1 hypothetical protein [Alphaproteobacteria bacterium]